MEFFRHCPACGRRFHIRLESKKIVGFERETRPTALPARNIVREGVRNYSPVIEGPPVIFDIEKFQFAYKCGHCGHEWSEKHVEEHKES